MVKKTLLLEAVLVLTSAVCGGAGVARAQQDRKGGERSMAHATATFAGGCFWCMEPPFEKLAGVISVTSGYTGGTKENPTYEEVSSGKTGHAEAIQVVYDPSKVSYEKLLETFWHNVDPTQPDGQFTDHGRQYRTAIFYHDEEQKRLAEASKQQRDRQRKGEFIRQPGPPWFRRGRDPCVSAVFQYVA